MTIHLNVNGAAAYIDFLKRAFNAEEMHRSPGPGGKLMHATMQIGDSKIMLADDFCEEFHMTPFVKGNYPFVINLYVPDANAAWEQALAAGCQVRFPLADQFWGDRYGQVTDPFGFYWAISQQIAVVSPEEAQEKFKKTMAEGRS